MFIPLMLLVSLADNSVFCGNVIDPDFLNWMNTNLGAAETAEMVRDELVTGSFGGGVLSSPTTFRPVILVNGLNNEAGTFGIIRSNFTSSGFPQQYIFATTWGPGAAPLNLTADIKMECRYVNHTRRFIQIVKQYTGASQVDVIAYSMGAPIARKAILGGACIDTNENVGNPITSDIHTFVSVAGANQGAQLCLFSYPSVPVCNSQTGLKCGSTFLQNVNAQGNFEATTKKYNLASTGDEMVGYYLLTCGKKSSQYTGAQEYTIQGKSHQFTCLSTPDIQLNMLKGLI